MIREPLDQHYSLSGYAVRSLNVRCVPYIKFILCQFHIQSIHSMSDISSYSSFNQCWVYPHTVHSLHVRYILIQFIHSMSGVLIHYIHSMSSVSIHSMSGVSPYSPFPLYLVYPHTVHSLHGRCIPIQSIHSMSGVFPYSPFTPCQV